MKHWVLAIAVGLLALVAWLAWPGHVDAMLPVVLKERSAAAVPAVLPSPPPPAAAGSELERVPLPPVDSSAPAWLSMAEARENGDARTPPIARATTPAVHADAAQLADPKAYAAFERSQHEKLLASFVVAAQQEVPRLRADLERGRAAGIDAAELAKVEEKIRRIEQQREATLKAHPTLAAATGQH
jgi:hypothetical protein